MSSIQDLPTNQKGKPIRKYIGKRGYIIKKEYFPADFIVDLKEKLTVRPNVNIDYAGIPDAFPVYREGPTKIYIPKFYGLEHYGDVEANLLPPGLDINIQLASHFQPRPNQKEPIEVSQKALEKQGGGILALSTGYGKTNIALYLIQKLAKKTLVIVHKEFLMNQWKERIETFLPGTRVGTIQGPKVDIEDKDIVLGMLQSISSKTYPLDTFDSFGFVVIDECHRIPCHHFSKALFKINCPKMLGLSATPKRDDGLTKILKWFIGDIIFEAINEDVKNVEVKRYIIKSDNEKYQKEIFNQRGAPMIPTMISHIVEYSTRNRLILNLIRELRQEDRRILLLSDRRLHLEWIYNSVEVEKICTVGYYVGGMKQGDLKASEGKELILGTYSMAAEGMDIPSLNTLILATPKSKITQAVGRIVRKKHLNLVPLVVDIVDGFSLFAAQGMKRLTHYKKSGYPISDYKAMMKGSEIQVDFYRMIPAKFTQTKSAAKKFNPKTFSFSESTLPDDEDEGEKLSIADIKKQIKPKAKITNANKRTTNANKKRLGGRGSLFSFS